MPTRKRMPSTRCSTSECDDTSMTACVQPASTIRRRSFCNSYVSGVVCSVCSTSSPMTFAFVPIRPTFVCRHCSSMCLISVVTVVLPLVPVTPIMVSSRDGLPKNSQQMRDSARRLSATRIYGISTSGFFWQSTTAAPRATAAPMKRWPSDSYPQTAANRSPGCVVRESKLISRTSSSGSAVHSHTSRTDSSRLSFIRVPPFVRQYLPSMLESLVTSVTSTTVP